jgi:hypothetical protein
MSAEPSWELIAELDAPGAGNWQGAIEDDKTGDWYVIHSRGSYQGGSAEEVLIYRFNPDGKYLKQKMVLVDGGHIYGAGVYDDVIWIQWNDKAEGNDIVTFPFQPNKTIKKSDKSVTQMHVFTDDSVHVSFSPSGAGLVFMEGIGRPKFTKRLRQDVLDNKDNPQGVTVSPPDNGVLQGFSIVEMSLYLLYGRADEKAWIEKYSFETGDLIGKLDVTSAGLNKGEKGKCEPEGMNGRTFGIKVFEGTKRRMRIYKLINF